MCLNTCRQTNRLPILKLLEHSLNCFVSSSKICFAAPPVQICQLLTKQFKGRSRSLRMRNLWVCLDVFWHIWSYYDFQTSPFTSALLFSFLHQSRGLSQLPGQIFRLRTKQFKEFSKSLRMRNLLVCLDVFKQS